MKGLLIIISSFIFLCSFNNSAYSQKQCKNYVVKNCDAYGDPFKYSGQSKSALFEIGQKSLVSVTVYAGFEYRVSICAQKNMKNIYFRIREDNTIRSVLYDSSVEEEDFLEKMFYVKTTKNLLIEVIVPEGDVALDQQEYEDRYGCVGVSIEYDKRKSLGFE